VGITTLPCKKENIEKPTTNSAEFCGGGQGLSWAVEPRKVLMRKIYQFQVVLDAFLPHPMDRRLGR
jgi:hypothetical protein